MFPIEQEITQTVVNRPSADLTSLTHRERELLNLFAIAFKESRGTRSIPPIYPDDQLELLLWGFDEMTLFTFKLKFQEKFNHWVTLDLMWKAASAKGATVRDLMDFCIWILKSKFEDAVGKSNDFR